jgi:hypothetical protein
MLPQRTPARRPALSPARTPRKRRHLHLIDPADGAEILPDRRVYTHEQLTPWKVELAMDDPTHAEYRASFRAVASEEQEYVAFTLTLPDHDLYPLRLFIFPNNEIEYESHIPLTVRVRSRKKTITVRLLARVRTVPEGVAVTYLG